MPSPVKDAYLVVYNLACAGGWSYVLLACVSHILAGSEPQALYDEVEKVLQVVQTAALMEVRLCVSHPPRVQLSPSVEFLDNAAPHPPTASYSIVTQTENVVCARHSLEN